MSKKKVEHVVFDGMRKIKKNINVSKYNTKTHSEDSGFILHDVYKNSDLETYSFPQQKIIKIKMGTVSIGKDNFEIHSVDQALQIIKNAMLDEKEIWISGDNVYPSMAICLDGEYAAITYFQSEDGEMWLSYNENNQKVVTFLAGGEEWIPEPNAVIGINDMLSCVKEFLNSYERPTCICWQDL